MARPLALNRVYERRLSADGVTDVTVGERIVEQIARGAFVERACRGAGVGSSTYYDWLSRASKARARVAGGGKAFSVNERDLVAWLDELERVEAEWEQRQLDRLDLAMSGHDVVTVTEKFTTSDDGEPVLVERTVVRKTGVIDTGSIRWLLRQRFPDRYKEDRANVPGVDTPGPDAAEGLIGEVETYLLDRG